MNEQTTRRGIVNHAHGRYPGWQLYEKPLPDRLEQSVDWRIRFSNHNKAMTHIRRTSDAHQTHIRRK